MENLSIYLKAGYFANSDHPSVIEYARQAVEGCQTQQEKAVQLFYKIRDSIRYNPYRIILKPEAMQASFQVGKDYGYCIEKSNLYAACARVLGIPSRLSFANVRNHLGTARLEQFLRTDLLVFHGFAEIYLDGRWIKVTPVFDKSLCDHIGVSPLDFDGQNDCVFQQSDKKGQPFMEYVEEHGYFEDIPFDQFVAELRKYYPHLFQKPVHTEFMQFEF